MSRVDKVQRYRMCTCIINISNPNFSFKSLNRKVSDFLTCDLERSRLSEAEPKKEEKPIKLEKVAEDTGELIGKGIRKTWNITKSFGKGVLDSIEKKEEQKSASNCPHCGALFSPDSNFCSRCGKKL